MTAERWLASEPAKQARKLTDLVVVEVRIRSLDLIVLVLAVEDVGVLLTKSVICLLIGT